MLLPTTTSTTTTAVPTGLVTTLCTDDNVYDAFADDDIDDDDGCPHGISDDALYRRQRLRRFCRRRHWRRPGLSRRDWRRRSVPTTTSTTLLPTTTSTTTTAVPTGLETTLCTDDNVSFADDDIDDDQGCPDGIDDDALCTDDNVYDAFADDDIDDDDGCPDGIREHSLEQSCGTLLQQKLWSYSLEQLSVVELEPMPGQKRQFQRDDQITWISHQRPTISFDPQFTWIWQPLAFERKKIWLWHKGSRSKKMMLS